MNTTYTDNKRVVVNNNNNHNNSNNNKRNPLSTSNTPKKPIFQDAVVAKSDVGEFQGGYFIMSSNDNDQKIKKPVSQSKYSPQRKRLPTVSQLNNAEENNNSNMDMKALKQQQQQQYLQIKNRHQQYHQQFQQQQQFNQHQQHQDNSTESILLIPSLIKETNLNDNNSPKKLNTSNNRIVSPQSKHQYGTSPPRSNSPTKNGKVVTSPSTNWAAGKWSNSPAASALPVLDFDDFFSGNDDNSNSGSFAPPQYQQPPVYQHPQPTEQPNLESMSNQLKMLLNINSTVAASTN